MEKDDSRPASAGYQVFLLAFFTAALVVGVHCWAHSDGFGFVSTLKELAQHRKTMGGHLHSLADANAHIASMVSDVVTGQVHNAFKVGHMSDELSSKLNASAAAIAHEMKEISKPMDIMATFSVLLFIVLAVCGVFATVHIVLLANTLDRLASTASTASATQQNNMRVLANVLERLANLQQEKCNKRGLCTAGGPPIVEVK